MTTNNSIFSLTIKLHYFLNDANDHTMEAMAFNECQKSFLRGIKSVQKYLDEPIEIRVSAKEEGSIVDTLLLIGSSSVISSVVTAYVTEFFRSRFRPTQSITDEVKAKLSNIQEIKSAIKSGLTLEEFNYIASSDPDLRKLSSNFFKKAAEVKQIRQIDANIVEPNIVVSVPATRFSEFFQTERTQESDRTTEEKIYVVSPVLVRGYHSTWKGVCGAETIEFKILDENFLQNVYDQEISFENGTYLNCEMKTITELEESTGKETIHREIIEVFNHGRDAHFEKPIPRKLPTQRDTKTRPLPGMEQYCK